MIIDLAEITRHSSRPLDGYLTVENVTFPKIENTIQPPSSKSRALIEPVLDFLTNPRVQGCIQAMGGLGEMYIGAQTVVTSAAILTPIGYAIVAHGSDQVATGMKIAITGRHQDTATSQVMQKAGVPREYANYADGFISISGSLGGIAIIRVAQYASLPRFTLPPLSTAWVLPENGGGAWISNRWYTEHALERMAPDTFQVRAVLNKRFIQRAEREASVLNHEQLSKWVLRNTPHPRGVPPIVVEAEIRNPGTTGIKVITNDDGNVVTVILKGE